MIFKLIFLLINVLINLLKILSISVNTKQLHAINITESTE